MDEGIIAMLVMPLVIFMIFVAPIWLILHYRSKKQVNQGRRASVVAIVG